MPQGLTEQGFITMDADQPTWLSHDFRAMGSDISLLIDADGRSARAGFQIGEEFFRRIEELLTRFKPTSELSYLNAHPGQWIEISPIFWGLLEAALGLARETGGIFDPTILPALQSAGYTRDIATVKAEGGVALAQQGNLLGRWAEVKMDPNGNRVRLPEGVLVDLGGIAKGWTAQQAALLAGQYGPCLVDAGGDLAASAPPHGQPGWPVSVAAPWLGPDGEQPDLVMMWLAHATLTTS
jgi:thiamine biosynthesis lipoprotein